MTDNTSSTDDSGTSAAEQRRMVRERYGNIATDGTDCCEGTDNRTDLIGYSEEEADGVDRHEIVHSGRSASQSDSQCSVCCHSR